MCIYVHIGIPVYYAVQLIHVFVNSYIIMQLHTYMIAHVSIE